LLLCFKYLSKKKCLVGLVLLVCLAATFNQGIFEIAHILSHKLTGGYSYHTHHGHLEQPDHDHFIADFSKIGIEQFSHSPDRPDQSQQFSDEKIPKICPSVVFLINQDELKHKNNLFFNLSLPLGPFLQTPTPPPDFSS